MQHTLCPSIGIDDASAINDAAIRCDLNGSARISAFTFSHSSDHFGGHFFPHLDHALVSLGTSSLGTVQPNIRGKALRQQASPCRLERPPSSLARRPFFLLLTHVSGLIPSEIYQPLAQLSNDCGFISWAHLVCGRSPALCQ